MNLNSKALSLALALLPLAACSGSEEGGGDGNSYDFTAEAEATISLKTLAQGANALRALFSAPRVAATSTAPTLCTSVVCFTPTQLTGIYYGTGLLIQSSGNGMSAYFGQDEWSSITGASSSYTFDAANPTANQGTLTCCNGSGDLGSENTYISDVSYLFGYLDATFTVSGVTGNTAMNEAYTLRFILASSAVTGAVRGDVLMRVDGSDASCPVSNSGCTGEFKWMDSTNSTFSTTRPTTPVVMNSSVVTYTNPFGTDVGNQEIPVLYVPVLPEAGVGVMAITESELRAAGNSFDFKFDPNSFLMFPTVLTTDINLISSKKELMSRVHLAGLPHSAQANGVGSPASTLLTITPAAF